MIIKVEKMVIKNSNVLLGTILVVLLLGFILILPYVFAVEPSGASTSEISAETAPADVADSENAYAGNVSRLGISGYTTTQSWQGFFGNVTGTIQLADSNDNVFYNWTLADPEGEVYASTNQSISWLNIQCFNFTANGTYNAESGTGGTTNLAGTNLTQLESQYSIAEDDVDGVNETFTFTGAGTHDAFVTASQSFSEGQCRSTRVYASGGPASNQFEEVLLYEPTTYSVVFASLIEQSLAGFDNGDHDFEMLVLEDGHGTDVARTLYYFFVELE